MGPEDVISVTVDPINLTAEDSSILQAYSPTNTEAVVPENDLSIAAEYVREQTRRLMNDPNYYYNMFRPVPTGSMTPEQDVRAMSEHTHGVRSGPVRLNLDERANPNEDIRSRYLTPEYNMSFDSGTGIRTTTNVIATRSGSGWVVTYDPAIREIPPGYISPLDAEASAPRASIEMSFHDKALYIQQLCSQTGRVWDDIVISEYEICKTKTEINKLFFTGEKPIIDTTLSVEAVKRLEAIFKESNEKHRFRTKIRELRNTCQSKLTEYNDSISELIKNRRLLNMMNQREDNHFHEAIKKTLAKGIWKLEDITMTKIKLILVNDCILTWNDDDKGMDMVVNMGKFILDYTPKENRIRVLRGKGNLHYDGHWHPHIDTSGGVCWGNASSTIEGAKETQDVEKIADTVYLLLNEYNDESPYVTLNDFEDVKNFTYEGELRVFEDYLSDDHDTSNYSTGHFHHDGKSYRTIRVELFKDKDDQKLSIQINGEFVELEAEWVCHDNESKNKYPNSEESENEDEEINDEESF